MPKVKEAGLRSDGELVQAVSDAFVFTAREAPVSLILPAVSAARESAGDQKHDDWIDILTINTGEVADDTGHGGGSWDLFGF
ncbi:hypothetical protein GCM10011360_01400 [Primorskyibacter flagellatus]|uniref:Uncharacterized protein n=1 Tax=Primorskyibacter flagellatus TaxID=1387277 RepID=A0A916ZXU7_9RHOB|nr:hypothetical protein [Primorskyibacter flagellatus]GGE16384.1 hypothetical protein GCM10011360_01400 [Primorskyibacter flagellatus]